MFKALLTPMTLYVHSLLYHISIGNIESSPFGLFVLILSLILAIFVVSSFYILYPLHFIISPRRLLVGCWTKPLYDLDLRTASMITCKVLPGGDEDNYLHSEPNWSLFICIQISSGKYHNWNLSLFRRSGLTYPDGDIKSSTITQGSQFPTTCNTTQCSNVVSSCQYTISIIGAGVPRWTCFPQTLSSKHPLTVQNSQVFIFIGVNFSSILIIKIIFYAPSVSPPYLQYNTNSRT